MDYILNFKNFMLQNMGPEILIIVLKVVSIIVAVFIVNKIIKKILEQTIRRMVFSSRFQSEQAEKKREDTLINIFSKTLKIVIIIIAGMMILETFGIPIAPMLAAVGVVGIALGFGGQYLIRDIITGLFIILENQYRVGDTVCTNNVCGLIENISLRMTTLRDMDGTVHHIPHGEIKTVSNLSKGYSRVNLNIGVSYSADLEKVKEIVNRIGEEMAKDDKWKDLIIQPPRFLRVDNFADSSVDIKIFGETLPAKQWEVTGELRWRIKNTFDKEGIDIPFPQRVIHQGK